MFCLMGFEAAFDWGHICITTFNDVNLSTTDFDNLNNKIKTHRFDFFPPISSRYMYHKNKNILLCYSAELDFFDLSI